MAVGRWDVDRNIDEGVNMAEKFEGKTAEEWRFKWMQEVNESRRLQAVLDLEGELRQQIKTFAVKERLCAYTWMEDSSASYHMRLAAEEQVRKLKRQVRELKKQLPKEK